MLPQMVQFFTDNDGEAVFRKEIVVPSDEAGKDMLLALALSMILTIPISTAWKSGKRTSARPGGGWRLAITWCRGSW